MPHEREVAVDSVLETVLGERCPWVPQTRVQHAAQLLARRMMDIGVDEHESFTMEMLVDAQATGHDLAKIMGSAPMTPGTPVAPARLAGLYGIGAKRYPGLPMPLPGVIPWGIEATGEGGQYYEGT